MVVCDERVATEEVVAYYCLAVFAVDDVDVGDVEEGELEYDDAVADGVGAGDGVVVDAGMVECPSPVVEGVAFADRVEDEDCSVVAGSLCGGVG
jgi:hypothetical protein